MSAGFPGEMKQKNMSLSGRARAISTSATSTQEQRYINISYF
jgi:hypothetical protein